MHNVRTKGEILERGVESNARKDGRKGGSEGKEGTLDLLFCYTKYVVIFHITFVI